MATNQTDPLDEAIENLNTIQVMRKAVADDLVLEREVTGKLADQLHSEIKAAINAEIAKAVNEIIGEDEPETWFNKDLVIKGSDYERRFLVEELPKRSRNALRAEQRAKPKARLPHEI